MAGSLHLLLNGLLAIGDASRGVVEEREGARGDGRHGGNHHGGSRTGSKTHEGLGQADEALHGVTLRARNTVADESVSW